MTSEAMWTTKFLNGAVAREREACAALADEWQHTGTVLLRAGEMKAGELRAAKAVASAIARAIRLRAKGKEQA